MITPTEIKQKYDLLYPYFEIVQNQLSETLLNFCFNKNFAYSSRIKKLDSLSEKIETGRFSCWEDLDDIVASVIIVPNLNYESEVIDFLKSVYLKVDLRKRGSTFKNHSEFRFDATRFIGTLILHSRDANPILSSIKFEIQIRTAFEHAWSVTTHDLAYKSQNIDWKVLRIVAQLKSTVEQMDMLALSVREINKNVTEHRWPEINIKAEIIETVNGYFAANKIPPEFYPKDLSRFVNNFYDLILDNLTIWDSKKWKSYLKKLFSTIEEELENLEKIGFPMSISLFQIFFCILNKNNLISENAIDKKSFFITDGMQLLFPDLLRVKFNQFDL